MKQSDTIKRACQVLRRKVAFRGCKITLPGHHWTIDDTATIREATKLYVETWIDPIIDMIEQGDTESLVNFIAGEPGDIRIEQ